MNGLGLPRFGFQKNVAPENSEGSVKVQKFELLQKFRVIRGS